MNHLSWACYAFRIAATTPIILPSYKGSTFHGAFGHALGHIGARFQDYFYRPKPPDHWQHHDQEPPRPYLLIPPLEGTTHYQPGDEMEIGLTLYGEAINYFMIAFAALEHLGQQMGLGPASGKFTIVEVRQITTGKPETIFKNDRWYTPPDPTTAAELFAIHSDVPATCVTVALVTRLRLKHQNRLARTTPEFSIFLERVLGRVNSLNNMYGRQQLLLRSDKQELIDRARDIHIQNSTARWEEWVRDPAKPHASQKFGGLLGEVIYCGNLMPFLPWLAIGQWTGIGGKTSFGLGLYSVDYQDISNDTFYE